MKRLRFPMAVLGLALLLLVVSLRMSAFRVLAGQPDTPAIERHIARSTGGGPIPATFNDASLATGVGTSVGGRATVSREVLELTPRVYLPMMIKGWFKEYWYQDDFVNWDSGWPWGTVEEDDGSPRRFNYGYKTAGDDKKVYHIRLKSQDDYVFLTGPAYAIGNFEYIVEVRRWTGGDPLEWGDEYGILISPTPIDPEEPAGESVYTFQIRLKIGAEPSLRYEVKKWTIDDFDHPTAELKLYGKEDEYLSDEAEVWNRLRIIRAGNELHFYITTEDRGGLWQRVDDPSDPIVDPALPVPLYIGFYAHHADHKSYPFEFQFDDVWLHVYP